MSNLVKANQHTLTAPVASEWQVMREQAEIAHKSGFFPSSVKTPEQALAIAMTGKELGWGIMTSMRLIDVIKGKPAISAKGLAALVLQRVPGARLQVVENSSERARLIGQRPGGEPVEFTFTIKEAEAAGLFGNEVWKKYPARMLLWRVTKWACDTLFPDVTLGAHTPDEVEEIVEQRPYAAPVQVEIIAPTDKWHEAAAQFEEFAQTCSNEAELQARFSELLPKGEAPNAVRSAAFKVYQARVADIAAGAAQ